MSYMLYIYPQSVWLGTLSSLICIFVIANGGRIKSSHEELTNTYTGVYKKYKGGIIIM